MGTGLVMLKDIVVNEMEKCVAKTLLILDNNQCTTHFFKP